MRHLPALLLFPEGRAAHAPPHDLSNAMNAGELSSMVQQAVPSLKPPVDPAQLAHLVGLLPQLAEETNRLIEQNAKLL